MFKFVRTLLLSATLLTASLASPTPKPSFVNDYAKSVALMYDGDRFRCSATAFDRTPTGFLFVSASHCVDGATQHLFLGDDQKGGPRYKATVLAYGDQTDKYDFSVLSVKAPADAFSVTKLGHNPTQIGERIFQISAPLGVGKAYADGYISMLSIPTSQVIDSLGTNWQGNILFDMLGPGPGSSGSTILCENQMKVCAILIGHIEGGMVAEPIERFEQWWLGIRLHKIPQEPKTHDFE